MSGRKDSQRRRAAERLLMEAARTYVDAVRRCLRADGGTVKTHAVMGISWGNLKTGAILYAAGELVGVAEIAAMAKVTRAAVTNWRARRALGFPQALVVLAAGPVFVRREVLDWLERHPVGRVGRP